MILRAGEGGYAEYRIPGVIATPRGMLACCEARMRSGSDWGKIDILILREDGVQTFVKGKETDTMNNPTLIADGEKTHLIYHKNYARAFHRVSPDFGETWSAPNEITDAYRGFPYEWNVCAPPAPAMEPGSRAGVWSRPCGWPTGRCTREARMSSITIPPSRAVSFPTTAAKPARGRAVRGAPRTRTRPPAPSCPTGGSFSTSAIRTSRAAGRWPFPPTAARRLGPCASRSRFRSQVLRLYGSRGEGTCTSSTAMTCGAAST